MAPNVTKEQYNEARRELEMRVGQVYQELEVFFGQISPNHKQMRLDDATRTRMEYLENLIRAYEEAQLFVKPTTSAT